MKKFFFTNLFSCLIVFAVAQPGSLKTQVAAIVQGKNATVGVKVLALDNSDSLDLNSELHFPLQSVFKFHIALAVLSQVEKNKLSLDQKIFIHREELPPITWSPIREKYPAGDISLSLADILKYTVSESDNNGCDILLKLIGGPGTVNAYIHAAGIANTQIAANEAAMHKDWDTQFTNWTTPSAAADLLQLFYHKKLLTGKCYDFLWKLMAETTTGGKRIKGLLPAGTPVAHKTGTSDTNDKGITAAVNDIGIVTTPNGKHYIICVFVSRSKEDTATNEKLIADISKASWDYFARP